MLLSRNLIHLAFLLVSCSYKRIWSLELESSLRFQLLCLCKLSNFTCSLSIEQKLIVFLVVIWLILITCLNHVLQTLSYVKADLLIGWPCPLSLRVRSLGLATTPCHSLSDI